MESTEHKTGLILTGGGARAAYQVGVLNALSLILLESGWPVHSNPFPIICGTSAGAINATALACRADDFGEAVRELMAVWANFKVEQVYRADSLGILRSGARWLSLFSFGWLLRKWRAHPPNSLLDNTPLVSMLHRLLDLPRLDEAMAEGKLHALAVTASSYTSGQHVTFYQCQDEIEPWRRTQRLAIRDQIGIDHLLASSAIPFIFPAIPVYINGRCEYCGDGSMRQIAPISPAIHLGASKVLVIGAGRMGEEGENAPTNTPQYPSLAQVAGHAMSSIFLDGLSADIERTNRVNQTLSVLTPEQRARTPLKPIETLVISPSQRIDSIASRHVASLPRPIRTLLGGIGATEARGSALASYLLFEKSFTRELIALGESDTYGKRDEVLAFFEPETARALQA
ncbi:MULTISPECIES: patatin-like phospholipase family protein [unclassified Herbaspirillum]|uniref:patatin-like phospholipase family protein n=1 Tax=unclassified Herbaspirillum TaxID=2624150 RepID=UPI001151A9B9|nr:MULTISPECIES: patatin-like phospholipase family protein [unclassified Herbaspirillum]MBB5390758.1 NTE family protein [Herbaspirillum sp. SJZ102]TQK08758.1 NTE family protein [Herbaspirillum sp. SJZ130]TQK14555.1 NTE family protein [Herbaspirillum sp. SJZ106]TWC66428.1 NTE family protein [Herbaspirillum sp. SJZ099]